MAKWSGCSSTHYGQCHKPDESMLLSLDLLARHTADYLERIRAQEALRDADRRKDEFLATLGHELRNPLAPLQTGLQLLRIKGLADDSLRASINIGHI